MSNTITLLSGWVNHPELLEYHREIWIKAFEGEVVRYVVYIDAAEHPTETNFFSKGMREALVKECERLGIEYRCIPEACHHMRTLIIPFPTADVLLDSSSRDSIVCQLMWQREVLENPTCKRIVFLQPDIFPYKKLQWNEITRGRSFYYKPQERNQLHYAWNGLCFFNLEGWSRPLKKLVNFDGYYQLSIKTDSGGGLWRLLRALPDSEKFEWSGLNSQQWTTEMIPPTVPEWVRKQTLNDPRNTQAKDGKILCYSEIQDNTFYHLRAGCNWDHVGREIHEKRYAQFRQFLGQAIQTGDLFTHST